MKIALECELNLTGRVIESISRISAAHDTRFDSTNAILSVSGGDARTHLGIRSISGSFALFKGDPNGSRHRRSRGRWGICKAQREPWRPAVTIRAMRAGVFPHTLNTKSIDESAERLDVIVGRPRKMSEEYAMVNSFGFGGVGASYAYMRFSRVNRERMGNPF
ncbi:hypothetical protein FAZ69_28330 [Trinickia terrae]|uniref:Beta-ketoacyl synthase C-terminal domain-containing protein n=1 Tax=Trinickia terrae TaxID=2571161 RepID=A0A4U1HQU6_9BURK|nr:hypothetical protein [Trinickia terrae]TKC81246.1 hypothetical protein FAZ69_28330 [Trinickia terrae]